MENTRTLHDFEKLKNALSDDLAELIKLLEDYDKMTDKKSTANVSGDIHMNMSLNEIIAEQRKILLGGTFKILVLGEFSTGKSTFLNALLKEKVLPVAVRPTTAAINQIKYSENKKVILNYYGQLDDCGNEITEGRKQEIKVEELIAYTTALSEEADNNSKQIKIVEVFYPTEYCKNSVEILDTPGFASINEHHDKITLNYLPNGNACIVLLNPGQPLSKSERHYLRLIRKYISKVFFVANKINLLEEEERKEALEYISEQLMIELNTEKPVKLYPLNAKLAASGDWDKSDFRAFLNEMERFLTSAEKAKEMISAPAFNALNSISVTKTNCKSIMAGLKFSPEEFDKRIQENVPKLDKIRRRQADLIQFISDREELYLNKLDIILNDKFKNLISQTSQLILNWQNSLDDLKTHLQQFLKEKLMEVNYEITKNIQEEMDYIIGEVALRFKDFKDDVQEYKTKVTGLVEVQSKELVQYNSSNENVLQDVAIQIGGAFGIGWLAGILLMGPIGWALAIGGNILFRGLWEDHKRKKKLAEIESEVAKQLNSELEKAKPEISRSFKDNIKDLKNYTNSQMNMLLQSVENVIKSIKVERKIEENKIKQKISEYSAVYDKLTDLERKIKDKYSSVN